MGQHTWASQSKDVFAAFVSCLLLFIYICVWVSGGFCFGVLASALPLSLFWKETVGVCF